MKNIKSESQANTKSHDAEKERLADANKKLQHCPFCGGKAEIKWDSTAELWRERGFYKVYCTDCITVHFNYFFTIDDAIARWNERVDRGGNI